MNDIEKKARELYAAELDASGQHVAAQCIVAPPQIPDGWALVPTKITPRIEAVYANDFGAYQSAQELHDAMLLAAKSEQQA